MHADAAYWALLGDEAAPDYPALAALLDAWQAGGGRVPRDLFEQAPARLAELLGRDEEMLAPLLGRRARLAQTRRLVERLPAGVDLLIRGERRYPRTLTESLGPLAPRALWYLGPLSLLTAGGVALFGTREAQQESLAVARAMAVQVENEGRVLLTGMARPLDRAALDAALAAGGAAVVVLGMGIAGAQPEIRRMLPYVVSERLLLLSPLGPQTPWLPALEARRVDVTMALAERAILVAPGEAGDTMEAVHAAGRLARPLAVWPASAAALAPGALPWTPGNTSTTETRRHRGITERQPSIHASTGDEPEARGPRPEAPAPTAAGDDLTEEVLRYLTLTRRKVTSKGRLLQALGVSEAALDRVLPSLIVAGKVAQKRHRSGAGYAAVLDGEPPPAQATFQPSLFGQDDPTSDARPASAPGAPRSGSSYTA